MNIAKNKYKDATPFETIQRARNILNDLGITIYEQSWNSASSENHSVRIEVDGFPSIGTNGKGTSRLFALASAYGELMERLQNKKLFNKVYGLKHTENYFHDEQIKDLKRFSEIHPDIMKSMVSDYSSSQFEELRIRYNSLNSFVEFRDVFADEKILLPSKLVMYTCGTNGMCAGNTAYEAISHGICEIMERFVSKKILFGQLELPEIPLDDIENTNCRSSIELFTRLGLIVRVKDCSLGGKYPVVGVLIMNKTRTKYQFRLGSESDFSIALERCLTEVFQGHDLASFAKSMLPVEINQNYSKEELIDNLKRITKNGSGQFPNSIFYNTPSSQIYKKAFVENLNSNKQGYEHLLAILQNQSFKLFVRNLSFLGFPSYKIYIPGMSEVFQRDSNELKDLINIGNAAKILLNIWNSDNQSLSLLAEQLDKYCREVTNEIFFMLGESPFWQSMNIYLAEMNPLQRMDIRMLNALIFYILSDYKKAHNYFSWFMNSIPRDAQYQNMDYYMCVEGLMSYKAGGLDSAEIKKRLLKFFEESVVAEVLGDFKFNDLVLLKHMALPSCPDCDNCKLEKYCMREEWNGRNEKINIPLLKFNSFGDTI